MSDPKDITYFPDTKDALEMIQNKGYEVFIISNQSGIGRGMYTLEDADRVFDQMQKDMESWGLKPYLEIVYCPHAPEDNCDCRKPSPKLLKALIKKWDINPEESYMVGDKLSDALAGKAAGLNSFLVGDMESDEFFVFKDRLAFSESLP